MADNQVKEGDQVSWQWSGSRPGGKVTDVKTQGEVSMTSHRGNEVKKKADGPENPAVKIERSGNDVVKKASEIDVEKPGDKHKEAPGEEKEVGKSDGNADGQGSSDKKGSDAKQSEKKENGEAQVGDKRKADDDDADDKADAKEDRKEDSADANDGDKSTAKASSNKKQKTNDAAPKQNGDGAPKKKGRPAKGDSSTPKKDTKKREPKKAATESGEPRRSGRVAAKSS